MDILHNLSWNVPMIWILIVHSASNVNGVSCATPKCGRNRTDKSKTLVCFSNFFSFWHCIMCKNWLFQKKIVPPCLGYQIFWSWLTLDFQSILPRIPEIFHFSHWTPWKSTNSNYFWSNPLEFSIDILNRGGGHNFFQEKPNFKWHLYHSWIDLMD